MKTFLRILAVAILAVTVAAAFTSCGGKEITVKINDAGVITEATAKTGRRIRDILADAQISLGEKDETDPQADSKLTEDVSEIIVNRYAKVVIVRGSQTKEAELTGGTVEDALKSAGFTLKENEVVDTDLKALLKDGMKITVSEGVLVTLTADGKTIKAAAAVGSTVKEFLEQQGVEIGKDDVCTEKMDEVLTDGMMIALKRVTFKEETKKETINYETKNEYSSSLDSGKTQVRQQGVNGEKEVTYKVKYIDGKEMSREAVSEKIIKEAVSQIVVNGTKGGSQQSSQSSDGGNSGSGEKTVVSKTPVMNCDGSGHGYYEIVYSDGSTEYVEF